MATLENIRKKGPLVAIVIGLALIAFVLGDAVRSSGFLFSRSKYEVAEISGNSISIQDYQKRIEEVQGVYEVLYGGALDTETQDQLRQQVWQDMVRTNIMEEQYEEVGIGVSSDELFELVQGENPAPLVRQLFTNQQTGQFNRQAVLNFLRNLDRDRSGKNKRLWLYIEDQIQKNRRFTKYNTAVAKGLYAPTPMAEFNMTAQNKIFDFDYISLQANSVSDSLITIENSDLKQYYNQHKQEFEQNEARNIEYVVFEAVPTVQDTADDRKWIRELKPDFAEAGKDEQFVRVNSEEPFDANYYHRSEIEDSVIREFAFNNEEGAIYGPYKEEGAFKLTKIAAIRQLSDSVRASQVVLVPRQRNQQAVRQIQQRADSLKTVIEEGGDIAAIARQYSASQNAQQGGDMGWFEMEDQPRAIADSAFLNETGDVMLVNTSRGFHILKIEEQSPRSKAVQLATVVRNIEPSEETLDRKFSEANKFAAQNNTRSKFTQAAQQQGLTKRVANNLEPLAEQIGNISNAREVVRWAYNAKVGNVSSVFEIQDQFIVATLTAVREKGIAPLEQVRRVITNRVTTQKKIDLLAGRINEAKANNDNLFDIARELNTSVKSANSVSFDAYQIEGIGFEPKVIGAAFALEEGEQDGPIKGNTGAYMLRVTSIQPPQEDANIYVNKNNLETNYQRRVNMQLYNALKDAVEFEDNRSRFY